PAGIHPKQIVSEIREKYGVLIAGGQGEIADKVFRITTIGTISEREIIATVGLLEMALVRLGFQKEPGAGMKALLTYFVK
ncbi:MAG TPA: alanine--glyoxylate aminotransferase family protein, partial [Candidatus Ozemobacteraceae bacterium]|nr:alanine--glyoxylate aminotransferase family protein [Candidatus Ozemobacteraceae bacterium]